jgi:hypothetical protein
MSAPTSTVLRAALVIGALAGAACSRDAFPVRPSPIVDTATTVAGGNWSGQVVLGDGGTTAFNMTLIARGLGATSGARTQAQAIGTVDVSGNFSTDSGLRGRVTGTLVQGSLQNGTFQGTLIADSPSCSRGYAGPITESSVAWVPTDPLPAGCLLTFSVQLPRDRGPDCQYSISLTRQSFSGQGGSGEVAVTTGAGCTWVPESTSPWIQFADPSPRIGAGRASFTVLAGDPSAREGHIRIAGSNQTFTVSQGPGCAYSVSPSNATFPDLGGSGRVTLTAPDGCTWAARSSAEWLSVAPADGAGNAVLVLSAQPNRGAPRQSSVSVGGQTIEVSQGLGCYFTVSPTSVTVPMGGGGGVLVVGGGAPGCTWTAQSDAPWITVTPAAGAGDGRVNYETLANTGSPRQGVLRVAGQMVTVSQGTCATPVAASLSLGIVPGAGATGSATVTAAPGCPWTAVSSVPWLTLSTASGSGSASIVVTVASNPDQTPRQGTLTIAGQTFSVSQEAAVCVYSFSQTTVTTAITRIIGASGTGNDEPVNVTTTPGCSWRVGVTTGVPWLQLVAAGSVDHVGSGSFSFRVDANSDDGPARDGTITVVGDRTTATVTVSQESFVVERVGHGGGVLSR